MRSALLSTRSEEINRLRSSLSATILGSLSMTHSSRGSTELMIYLRVGGDYKLRSMTCGNRTKLVVDGVL